METPTKKEGLMFEGVTVPPVKSKLPRVLFGGVLIAIIVASGLFVHSSIKKQDEKIEHEAPKQNFVSEQEKKETREKIAELYNSESAPQAPEGKDPFNYGLNSKVKAVPAGVLIFSGAEISAVKPYTQLYSLDIGSSTAKPKLLVPRYPTSAMAEFENPAKSSNFFMLTASDYSLKEERDGVSIHKYDNTTGKVQPYRSASGLYERNLAWSEKAGLLAFNRLAVELRTGVDLMPIDNWETVVINPSTDAVVTVISAAVEPQWSPDGLKLLLLKKDGLYLYTLATKSFEKIISMPAGGIVTTSAMVDLSNDGTHMLWTTAQTGMITVFEVTAWDAFKLTEVGRINQKETQFFWPKFSPDGKSYAVQAIDSLKASDDMRKNPRVEVRSTLGRDILYSHKLDAFYFDGLFNDDWIVAQHGQN